MRGVEQSYQWLLLLYLITQMTNIQEQRKQIMLNCFDWICVHFQMNDPKIKICANVTGSRFEWISCLLNFKINLSELKSGKWNFLDFVMTCPDAVGALA